MTTETIRGSLHSHHVPHIGLPQTEPVKRQSAVKTAPIGAQDLAQISANGERQTKEMKLAPAMKR